MNLLTKRENFYFFVIYFDSVFSILYSCRATRFFFADTDCSSYIESGTTTNNNSDMLKKSIDRTNHRHNSTNNTFSGDSSSTRSIGIGTQRFITSLEPLLEMLRPLLEMLRIFIRSAYKTYQWYSPELSLGKCMVKYAHISHPEMMRRFRIENISKIGRGIYLLILDYINSFVNGGTLISRYVDEIDSDRIALKIAQITNETPIQKRTTISSLPNDFGYGWNYFNLMTPFTYNTMYTGNNEQLAQRQYYQQQHRSIANSHQITQKNVNINEPDSNVIMRQRQFYDQSQSRRSGKNFNPDPYGRRNNNDNVAYIGPRQFPADTDEMPDMDPNASIKLNNKTAEEEAEKLFDIEPIILKSLGIEPSTVKRWSPMYCAKEYTVDIIKRITKNLLLDQI